MRQFKLFDIIRHKNEKWINKIQAINPSNNKMLVEAPEGKRWVYRYEVELYNDDKISKTKEIIRKTDLRFFG